MVMVSTGGAVVTTSDPVNPANVVYKDGMAFRMSDGALYVTSGLTTAQVSALLSTFPVRTGLKIAAAGDSQTRNNHYDGSSFDPKLNSQLGYLTFANQRTNHRFYYDATLNFGVFGDKTTDLIARLPTVTASNADIYIVRIGTNDLPADSSGPAIVANLLTIWAALRATGARVIAGTIAPRSDGSMTAARSKVLQYVNTWMRETAPLMQGLYLWDSYQNLMDFTSSTSAELSGLSQDHLHFNCPGAFADSTQLVTVLNAVAADLGIGLDDTVCSADLYDATYNVKGNQLTNFALTGTGGTKSGTGMTGSVADSWTLYKSSGSTILCAATKGTKTLANGQTVATQILTVSTPGGGAATEEISFFQDYTAAGASIYAGAKFDVASLSGAVSYVDAKQQAQYDIFSVIGVDGFYDRSGGSIGSLSVAYNGKLQTPARPLPGGGSTVRTSFNVSLDCTSAASVVVTIWLPFARGV